MVHSVKNVEPLSYALSPMRHLEKTAICKTYHPDAGQAGQIGIQLSGVRQFPLQK
jgi:hypothetical protein